MKIPSLKSLLLAMVARFGNQSAPTPYINRPKPAPFRQRFIKPKRLKISKRFESNQRQARKDRRRAFAAGNRKAFA